MDTDKILMAIEERKKWEARAASVEMQLEELREKRTKLGHELKAANDKLKYYGTLADNFREYNVAKASGLYYAEGSRHLR